MPYKSEKGMDEKQDAILKYIREYQETSGHAPSVSDIVLETGIGPSVVDDYLEKLEHAGYIEQNRYGIKLITPVQQDISSITDHKLRVFICHSSQDKPIVRELYQRLNAEGWIDPWLDSEKLLPGQDWDMEIEKAVEAANAVIVCLSNNSVSKEGYIQKELRFVLDISDEKPEDTIFVTPIRIDNCLVPRRLKKWQYVDYFPADHKEWAYQRLRDSLKLRLGQDWNLMRNIEKTNLEAERRTDKKVDNFDSKQLKDKIPFKQSGIIKEEKTEPDVEVKKHIDTENNQPILSQQISKPTETLFSIGGFWRKNKSSLIVGLITASIAFFTTIFLISPLVSFLGGSLAGFLSVRKVQILTRTEGGKMGIHAGNIVGMLTISIQTFFWILLGLISAFGGATIGFLGIVYSDTLHVLFIILIYWLITGVLSFLASITGGGISGFLIARTK